MQPTMNPWLRWMCFFAVVMILATMTPGAFPREAPSLSAQLGTRISTVEASHLNLLRKYFDEQRDHVDEFVFKVWVPTYAEEVFQEPDIANLWDQAVASEEMTDRINFISKLGLDIQQKIDKKRQELITPLDEAEREIERQLRDEYIQLRNRSEHALSSEEHFATELNNIVRSF